MEPNMIGAYGRWAAEIVGEGPAELSYRSPRFSDPETWRAEARAKTLALLAQPDTGGTPRAEILQAAVIDGVEIEWLRWRLPHGPPTAAVFMKPEGEGGPLPGILALHDHGGNKYFGWRKLVDVGDRGHPLMRAHRDDYYGGRAWASEAARRGYAVLCHDTFPFGSRRVLIADVPQEIRWKGAADVGEAEPEERTRSPPTMSGRRSTST